MWIWSTEVTVIILPSEIVLLDFLVQIWHMSMDFIVSVHLTITLRWLLVLWLTPGVLFYFFQVGFWPLPSMAFCKHRSVIALCEWDFTSFSDESLWNRVLMLGKFSMAQSHCFGIFPMVDHACITQIWHWAFILILVLCCHVSVCVHRGIIWEQFLRVVSRILIYVCLLCGAAEIKISMLISCLHWNMISGIQRWTRVV